VNWSKWDVQVRFASWMYALQAAKPNGNMHCTELEATLCFFLRYWRMRNSDPNSMQYKAASRAIGANLDSKVVAKIFDKSIVDKARCIIGRS